MRGQEEGGGRGGGGRGEEEGYMRGGDGMGDKEGDFKLMIACKVFPAGNPHSKHMPASAGAVLPRPADWSLDRRLS